MQQSSRKPVFFPAQQLIEYTQGCAFLEHERDWLSKTHIGQTIIRQQLSYKGWNKPSHLAPPLYSTVFVKMVCKICSAVLYFQANICLFAAITALVKQIAMKKWRTGCMIRDKSLLAVIPSWHIDSITVFAF